MSETTLIHEPGDPARYLECLNACFGRWGDEALWRWVFARDAGEGAASQMVITDASGAWIAGSGVSWRALRLASGAVTRVGIMTGSWTLPAARGRGCFTTIIEASRERVAARGGSLLLAFVTETNASRRRLEAAGAAMLPSRYVFATPETPRLDEAPTLRQVEADEALLTALHAQLTARAAGASALALEPDAWRAQLIDRPQPVELWALDGVGHIIAELAGDSWRAQALVADTPHDEGLLLRAALGHAQRLGKQLFCFRSDDALDETIQALGLGGVTGYITALIADADALQRAQGVASPAPDHAALADPASPWHLGPLMIQSGDRM